MSILGIGLLVVGLAFLVGSTTMQWLGIDAGRTIAPKYVWREFRRFGRGITELGLMARSYALVLH